MMPLNPIRNHSTYSFLHMTSMWTFIYPMKSTGNILNIPEMRSLATVIHLISNQTIPSYVHFIINPFWESLSHLSFESYNLYPFHFMLMFYISQNNTLLLLIYNAMVVLRHWYPQYVNIQANEAPYPTGVRNVCNSFGMWWSCKGKSWDWFIWHQRLTFHEWKRWLLVMKRHAMGSVCSCTTVFYS